MTSKAVSFDGVWKKFRLGQRHDSLRDLIPTAIRRLVPRGHRPQDLNTQEFWALQDVSFEVPPGGALGVIGPNGAGKSTTLKLLTKILKPTRGSCGVTGRIGALIEIAAGFHPDLTGRENIYLQGAVMGMKKTEIARQFDAIVDFSGTAAFIDTPVKRYSSGMNARLGFSIAAHLHPDVLIIDEVLSVGDMAFQQKCVERMHQFKADGVAIVFVSHNLQAVDTLCDECLYLQSRTVALGTTSSVLQRYILSSQPSAPSDMAREITITAEPLTNESNDPVLAVAPGTALTLRIALRAKRRYQRLALATRLFRTTDNLLVYDRTVFADEIGLTLPIDAPVSVAFDFKAHLTRGHYYVACDLWEVATQSCVGRLTPAATFRVEENRTHSGVADVDLRARVTSNVTTNAKA